MSDRKNGIDWEERRRVILEVQKVGGTAKDAGDRLGLQEDTIWKTSRRLGIRFPSRNGYHGRNAQKAKPANKTNGSGDKMRDLNRSCFTAYHQRRRFMAAKEAHPEQPFTDAELIEQAIAEGKVTRLEPGSGLGPLWLGGRVDNCVKPRAGSSRRTSTGWNV